MVDLEAIKKRAAAATQGPHRWVYGYNNGGWPTGFVTILGTDVELPVGDAELVAHAREDVLALVARVEELEKELARWQSTQPEPDEDT
jgi:hypothetical protein